MAVLWEKVVGVISYIAGQPLTPRDWSQDFARLQNLNITLSTIDSTLKATQPRSLVAISGTTLTGRDWSLDFARLQNLDVALSTRASEATLSRVQVESATGVWSLRIDHRYWGGTPLTGRDISLDLAKLQNLDVALSTLRSDLTGVLPRNITQVAGTPLTGRDWSADFAKLQNLDRTLTELMDTLKKNVPLTVLSSGARTSSGDTRGSPIDTSYGSAITFFLDVTAVSGTSPTLDLYIDIQDPVSGKWVNQDKFPTVTSTGTWALAIPVRSHRYSVRWVLGGTTPSFTFSVGAVLIK